MPIDRNDELPPAAAPPRDPGRPLQIIGLVTLAAVAAMILGWRYGVRDNVVPKRLGEVKPGLIYRSGQLEPDALEDTLTTFGIERIIALNADDPPPPAETAEAEIAARRGLQRDIFPLIGDGTGNIENYALAIAAIDESVKAGDPVLVHCAAGTYRTGGVVVAYRMLIEGASPDEARRELLRYDWDPADALLVEYLDGNMGTLAARLVELGVIERVPDPLPRLGAPPAAPANVSSAPAPAPAPAPTSHSDPAAVAGKPGSAGTAAAR
jgi:hypothetical protein